MKCSSAPIVNLTIILFTNSLQKISDARSVAKLMLLGIGFSEQVSQRETRSACLARNR
jgi:hypothetical protein